MIVGPQVKIWILRAGIAEWHAEEKFPRLSYDLQATLSIRWRLKLQMP